MLPAGTVDVVLLVDAYHEFDRPWEMMRSIVRALKPGGRVALVEFRAEDSAVPIKALHKMSEAQARRELEATGLSWIGTDARLPWQHLIWFRK
jgi:ubiquinone/menaquinone biosynthesis C-methylase UbiE